MAAWAALFAGLEEAQRECLDAHDAATSAAKAGAPTPRAGGAGDGSRSSRRRRRRKPETKLASRIRIRPPKPKPPTETEGGRAQRGFGVARASVERLLPRGAGCRSVDSVRYPGSRVAGSPQAAARHRLPLARLFLRFDAPRADGARRSGKAWRNGLARGLRLLRDALGGGRSLKALERGIGSEIRASLEHHVSADESDLAAVAIGCLGRWGLPHLSPENAARLQRVADEKTMKLELINLNLTADSAGGTHGRHPRAQARVRQPGGAVSAPAPEEAKRQARRRSARRRWLGSEGWTRSRSRRSCTRSSRRSRQARDKRETKHTKHTKHTKKRQTLKTPGPPWSRLPAPATRERRRLGSKRRAPPASGT